MKSRMEIRDTKQAFVQVVSQCRSLYSAKLRDYGAAWHVLRPSSLTDQIYIKANRIRTLQVSGHAQVEEGIREEFVGIVNYSIMALIQLELGYADGCLPPDIALSKYDAYAKAAFELMCRKNHDYGEAWRNMRQESLVDIILMKLLRVKQIEDAGGKTSVSEGLDANYFDIMNYAVFALIRIAEEEKGAEGSEDLSFRSEKNNEGVRGE